MQSDLNEMSRRLQEKIDAELWGMSQAVEKESAEPCTIEKLLKALENMPPPPPPLPKFIECNRQGERTLRLAIPELSPYIPVFCDPPLAQRLREFEIVYTDNSRDIFVRKLSGELLGMRFDKDGQLIAVITDEKKAANP